MLSDAAVWRLVHYCRRVALTPPEYVEQDGRGVRYVGKELRRLVWRDGDVREALLAADDRAVWDALLDDLAAHGASSHGLDLLDLITAVSLEGGARTTSRVAGDN